MRRAVITGIGIVSSIGDNKEEVLDSLKEGRSGITFAEEYAEMGFRSHVYGIPNMNLDEALDRKLRRFMGDGAGYNYIAMLEAIQDSKLKEGDRFYTPIKFIEKSKIFRAKYDHRGLKKNV